MKTLDKVVYQIYPKSFCDADGDGWGDIRGVIGKLDNIQKLGVDFIWFNPMTISPQNDNGYDVEDYCQIDARYGTMEDVEELIEEAGKRGIRIAAYPHDLTGFRSIDARDVTFGKFYAEILFRL